MATRFQIYAYRTDTSEYDNTTLVYDSIVSNNILDGNVDVLSPKLKLETNKAGSLEFIVLPSNQCYSIFRKMITLIEVYRDNVCIFKGRVTDIKTDIFKQRTVTCEECLAYLADTVQEPNKRVITSNVGSTKKKKRETYYILYTGNTASENKDKNTIKMTVGNYFTALINHHNSQLGSTYQNFTVGNITVEDRNNQEVFERSSYQDTSSVINSDLLSVYGGVLRVRYGNNTTYIDWLDDYSVSNSQQIKLGVNLLELDEEPPTDKVWSVLLPVGEENLTVQTVNNGSIFVEYNRAVSAYGRVVHYHKFDGVKSASELLSKAVAYLGKHAKVFRDNLVVKAVDMHYLDSANNDPIELGDIVNVQSSAHGLNRTMAVISMELDLQNPENSSYTIGTIMPPDKEAKKEDLSEKQANSRKSSSRGIGKNSDAIDKLNGDMAAASNNINVNAENIAVNAQNIAVNAENIAVVAKNISVAAETIDVKAREIKVSIEDAEGNIAAKIELTEDHLSSEFNKTIYGDNLDGNGGVVADYKSRITQSAQSLTSEYTAAISNAKGEVTTAYRSEITQTADSINTEVAKKVGKTEIISRINQTAETILIEASKINLSGYVTATDFSATNSKLNNLVAGTETATKIVATSAKVTTGTFEIGDSSNAATLKYRGNTYYSLTVSMPGVTSSASVLGLYYANSAYQTTYSLAHSHSVTTNNDGTITIGGSVATNASGRSFRIADTKAYKDGVSAAIASVTISSVNKDPNYSVSYDSTNNKYTIPLKAVASNNNSGTANYTFYATDSYNYGYNKGKSDGQDSVTISWVDRNPDRDDSYNSSSHNTTVYLKAVASNGASKTDSISVAGTGAYSDGYNSGLSSAKSSILNYMWVECTAAQSDNDDGIYDAAQIRVHYYDPVDSEYDYKNFNDIAMWRVYNNGKSDVHDSLSIKKVTINSNGSAQVVLNILSASSDSTTTKSLICSSSYVTDNHN